MLEKYYKYRYDYKDYIIFIKSGMFYECIGNDALIINNIFNYKIKKFSNTLRVGFPIKSGLVVENTLKELNIYYIMIDDNEIVSINDKGKNKYSKYSYDIDIIQYNFMRIDRIINYLEDNITDKDINDKLDKIDRALGI